MVQFLRTLEATPAVVLAQVLSYSDSAALVEEMRRAVSMMSLEGAMMGTAAAEFRCVDHTGSVRSLREFLDAGKIVVLWFYPKAITGG
tara:strand:+ start:263 stop:526 length:264 start_codon:yes stop_codon:yes gene_type:complete